MWVYLENRVTRTESHCCSCSVSCKNDLRRPYLSFLGGLHRRRLHKEYLGMI